MSEKALHEITVEEMIEQNKTYLGFIESRYKEMQKRCEKLNDNCEYIELNSYGEGIKKGEQLMQEKANKILEYYSGINDADVLSELFGDLTYAQIFGDIETVYNRIINYEQEKEEKEKEIHVGDVVKDIGGVKTLLVTNVANPYVYTLDKDGRDGVRNQKDVVKTGEHYPLDEFLKGLK